MPIPLIPAIVGSILEGVVDAPPPTAPIQQPVGAMNFAAVLRVLPADAVRGQMDAVAMGKVQMDGKAMLLSPAAQIRNEANMIVLPTMVQQGVPVRYTMDPMGYVSRIWILSSAELAASR